MRLPKAYVPDELWNKLGREIHHFEYGEKVSIAVYEDGRREKFDSEVTPERMEQWFDLQPRVLVHCEVTRENFRGVLTGWTA